MTELTCHHQDLSAMMRFVRDEIREDVRNVERQVAPHVSLGWRDASSRIESEYEKRFDPFAASSES